MWSLSSSSFSDSATNVIDLVDDDECKELPSLSTDTDPFRITSTSQHYFPSYQTLREYLDQYAAGSGFEVRYPANKGQPDQPGHAGTARCWCYPEPPVVLKPEEQQQPSHQPPRTIVPRAANRSGNQVKCGCPWRINFTRRVSGEYGFTTTRHLLHSGHECVASHKLAVTVDSLRVVPEVVERAVYDAVVNNNHCSRRVME